MPQPPTLYGLATALIVLGILFGVPERIWGARAPSLFRLERITDLLYWFTTPMVTRAMTLMVTTGIVIVIAWMSGLPTELLEFSAAMHARSPLRVLPAAAQLGIAFVVADFLQYWHHRLAHTRYLWKLHSIHHSPQTLDWLASVRIHPLNDLPNKLTMVLPILFLGVEIKVFAVAIPLLQLWTIFNHSNLPVTLGPLRYVVTTPGYHRWHHSAHSEARNKNFAGLFPIWDLLFGTFFMPNDRSQPTEFGAGPAVPAGFFAQLAHPFMRRKSV